jgi:hypothetical protein
MVSKPWDEPLDYRTNQLALVQEKVGLLRKLNLLPTASTASISEVRSSGFLDFQRAKFYNSYGGASGCGEDPAEKSLELQSFVVESHSCIGPILTCIPAS